MDTTNEKKVMLTDEDLDSVSGGKGSGCKHERNNIVCRRYDFEDKDLSYEEQICPICYMHRIIEHHGSNKKVYIDWFVYSGSSYLQDKYHGNGLSSKLIL